MSKYKLFAKKAREFLGERVYEDYLRRFAYGTDASCYRYIPKVVVKAYNEEEIIKIYDLSNTYNIPITFRAAGSSLSGQASSDSVLVLATHHWQDIHVGPNAQSIRLSCGVIGSSANEALKPYGKKIGPDPATLSTAMIGGILSNNSSGMCCGVKQNSYNTILAIRVILNDGSILDTSDTQSIKKFLSTHSHIIDALLKLREEILGDTQLSYLIKKKYKIKNTTGYSLNALLDFSDPIEIIKHLFIGSEGTLGFISECEYECVPDFAHKACALLFYDDMAKAAQAIEVLAEMQNIISSAEVMDYASLKSVQGCKDVPEVICKIRPNNACILLQTEANDAQTIQNNLSMISQAIAHISTALPPQISDDESIYNQWWKIRKGLLPIAASSRRTGSCVITEDICFEIRDFGAGVTMIQNLFDKYGFSDSGIIFGHALSGNLHFIITPILSNPAEKENFEKLVEEMAQKVSDFGGSIKAEHGTGRMVAPFVELEWGKKAYHLNQKIKHIFDPKNLINPDVIISCDPQIHTKNLKETTEIETYLDGCMECGFCEKICPSKNITLTPRQRIAVHREMERLKINIKAGKLQDLALLKELEKGYSYISDETCAACEMCATICPLEISAGEITLKNRNKKAIGKKEKIAKTILKNMKIATRGARFGLNIANFTSKILGENTLANLSSSLRKYSPIIPKISNNLPQKNIYNFFDKPISNTQKNSDCSQISHQNLGVIYFTTCINRSFAPSKKMPDKRSIQEVFESLCKKAHTPLIYPKKIHSMCCGKAFIDYEKLSKQNIQKNIILLEEINPDKKIPIVLDHTACSAHFSKLLKNSGFKIYDLSAYIYEFLLPFLKITAIPENIGLYTMCAGKKIGLDKVMFNLAKQCTNGEILIHKDTACCGFAGNKGFFTPELNESALEDFEKFYQNKNISRGFGSSSTCEIGLSDKSGFAWQHIAYLVDHCSHRARI